MSVDGKESWLENRAIELFEEIQRKNPHLSWNEIDELCYKQAEEDRDLHFNDNLKEEKKQ